MDNTLVHNRIPKKELTHTAKSGSTKYMTINTKNLQVYQLKDFPSQSAQNYSIHVPYIKI